MSAMDDIMETIEMERNRMSHAIYILKRMEKERDGSFCDLTLVSSQRRLKAHKIIVCTQSRVIWTACTGQYKEASGVYEFRDWPNELVQCMADYMYTGNYEDWPADSNGQGELGNNYEPSFAHPLTLHATMADLADVYMISGLRKLAERRFLCAARAFRKIVIYWRRYRATQTTEDHTMKLLGNALSNVPEFAVDFAMSVDREPLLGRCSACGADEIVPLEPAV